ncbi:MAG: bifunctional phosphoribosylaminoimidazolecarboxamide formyltransferase/IMP cyclohydrolase, partial [Methylocella sp.]
PRPIRRALISVSDKTGIIGFARALADAGVELISTGGTARALADAGLKTVEVAALTGFPEIMDGRVKTLHPKIHGGLLAMRGDASHEAAQKKHGIGDIDLLAVNLYPFEEKPSIDTIDVGGPAMIRAAAKNHESVTVIVDPEDYAAVIAEINAHGGATTHELRRKLAAKAFGRTAAYDAAIANWFGRELNDPLPAYLTLGGRRLRTLRYGENPHQQATLYANSAGRMGIASARQLQGKELSYNNINDTDAALECLAEFDTRREAACVIVKHANPCGVATGASLLDAYRKALRCDPTSAFGGIVALNRKLDAATAEEIVGLFTEVIVAPGADDDAVAVVAAKKKLRLLTVENLTPHANGLVVRSVAGGLLAQTLDNGDIDRAELKTVTRRALSAAELADLRFAFRVVKHVKSNAIVFARDGATTGIGAGQMSRVDAVHIA